MGQFGEVANILDRAQGINGTRKTRRAPDAPRTRRKAPSARRLSQGERIRAGAFFALAGAGLAVSLPHLAGEVYSLTGAGMVAAWFLAIVIDAGMIACKAHLSAHNGANRAIAWTIVASCTLVSMVLNSHAFLEHASTTFGAAAAIGFGTFLPLFIVSLSYMGAEILHRKR